MWCSVVILLSMLVSRSCSSPIKDVLNQCQKGKYHKARPGPESTLYKQCLPWKERSCCTKELTEDIHTKNPYNFNFDHCKGKSLSAECQKHFMQDHCFYECSPNVGPWLKPDQRSWRKQRFVKVPLCASDCQAWFNSCANDYTCTSNWATGFEWQISKNGTTTNTCPSGSTCVTFQQKFGDAKTFCEMVWDNSWAYTNDSEPCMRLWFNDTDGNPNDRVAQLQAHHLSISRGCSWVAGRAYLVLTASWVVAVHAIKRILHCT